MYGTFAVSQAVYGFAFDGFGVVFHEPMMVLAPGRFLDRQAAYLKALLFLHVVASLALSLAVSCGYPLFTRYFSNSLADALFAMSLAAPAMLLLQLVRRISSARFQLHVSALAGVSAFALLFGLLDLQQSLGATSVPNAYAALGISSAVVSLAALFYLRLLAGPVRDRGLLEQAWSEHRHWTFWGLPTVVARWFPINAYYVFTSMLVHGPLGFAAAGKLRALMSLVMPMLQLQGALSSSLLSTLASRSQKRAQATTPRLLGLVAAASSAYALALIVLGKVIVPVVFGRNYLPSQTMLWCVGATLVSSGIASVLRATLLAVEQPRRVFFATTLSAVVTVTAGLWAVHRLGVTGAALGMAVASATQAVAMGLMLVLLMRNKRT
jgi:O-antigen/teichoic acid export membrane protein